MTLESLRLGHVADELERKKGWDPATGWPNRSTLESLGLAYVARELENHERIGRG